MVVEDFGVFFLLVGGEGEHGLQHVELLFPAEFGGKGVAVPGLAFAGEGAHEVFKGFAFLELFGHKNIASLRSKYGGSISQNRGIMRVRSKHCQTGGSGGRGRRGRRPLRDVLSIEEPMKKKESRPIR